MFLLLSAALFVVFAVNVALGAFSGAPFLGDIGEMILLFSTAIVFVIAILQREAAAKNATNKN